MSYSAQRHDGKERRQIGGSIQGGKSQGHRGAGAEEEGEQICGEGEKGERSKADAHIRKSKHLVTMGSNKNIQHVKKYNG